MISIKELKKSFNHTLVLQNLVLQIPAGERVALVGQNGCGKTTLIRCLMGLYQFQGEIRIFGNDIRRERDLTLKKMALVPQSPPPLKNTVKEIIAMTCHTCQFDSQIITEVAEVLGLELHSCMNTPFKGLSGGMKQKLLIACALARSPELLIMDEPTANLDPMARSMFFTLLGKLPHSTTMLLTSHRVDELSGIVSRVIELDAGKITMDDVIASSDPNIFIGQKSCSLQLNQTPSTVVSALQLWGFKPTDNSNLNWQGNFSQADSFRFYATLTRWSGIISTITITKT